MTLRALVTTAFSVRDDASIAMMMRMDQEVPGQLYGQMISPLLASTSLLVLIDLRSIDMFKPDIHMPINLSGCAHE